jgi:hypothetical protein
MTDCFAIDFILEEIILDAEPKAPVTKRKSIPFEQIANLEALADAFRRFINENCIKALSDTTSNIKLKHSTFLKRHKHKSR